jgi:hypothetical protein
MGGRMSVGPKEYQTAIPEGGMRRSQRARIVTDTAAMIRTVASQLPRELYEQFDALCSAEGTLKGAKIRELITECVNASRRVETVAARAEGMTTGPDKTCDPGPKGARDSRQSAATL